MKKKIKRSGKFHVYIAECRDGTYYTGSTNNIEKRIDEHNSGKRGAKYTPLTRKQKEKLVNERTK
jgi:putative endonuclease